MARTLAVAAALLLGLVAAGLIWLLEGRGEEGGAPVAGTIGAPDAGPPAARSPAADAGSPEILPPAASGPATATGTAAGASGDVPVPRVAAPGRPAAPVAGSGPGGPGRIAPPPEPRDRAAELAERPASGRPATADRRAPEPLPGAGPRVLARVGVPGAPPSREDGAGTAPQREAPAPNPDLLPPRAAATTPPAAAVPDVPATLQRPAALISLRAAVPAVSVRSGPVPPRATGARRFVPIASAPRPDRPGPPPASAVGDAVRAAPPPPAAAPQAATPAETVAPAPAASAQRPPLGVRVFVMAPATAPEREISATVAAIAALGADVAQNGRTGLSISEANLRYYYAADRADAADLARALGVRLRDFTGYSDPPLPGVLEVWLEGGPLDEVAPPPPADAVDQPPL